MQQDRDDTGAHRDYEPSVWYQDCPDNRLRLGFRNDLRWSEISDYPAETTFAGAVVLSRASDLDLVRRGTGSTMVASYLPSRFVTFVVGKPDCRSLTDFHAGGGETDIISMVWKDALDRWVSVLVHSGDWMLYMF